MPVNAYGEDFIFAMLILTSSPIQVNKYFM